MSPETTASDQQLLERLRNALSLVTVTFPHFAGLAASVTLSLTPKIETIGVFESGRIAINPSFAQGLLQKELIFVLAHQLFHLALRTHERSLGSDSQQFNSAHDYIINDMLRVEMGLKVIPAGGLDWTGARNLSAEEILQQTQRSGKPTPNRMWNPSGRSQGACDCEGESASPGNRSTTERDVLDSARERELFPSETSAASQSTQAKAMAEVAAKATSLGAAMGAMKGPGRGTAPGSANEFVTALRGIYSTPWELALQRWLESVAPTDRTFYRPSRRGAERTDVVLPGRKREGWILNIVLDTSGSMMAEIPRALGAIADFCDALVVDQIRLVQCDTAVTSDQFLQPAEVARHDIRGFGGSDMSPALRYLADDPLVEVVIVLTDGEITYPPEEMPFAVLWVLSAQGSRSFQPSYGSVLHMQSAQEVTR